MYKRKSEHVTVNTIQVGLNINQISSAVIYLKKEYSYLITNSIRIVLSVSLYIGKVLKCQDCLLVSIQFCPNMASTSLGSWSFIMWELKSSADSISSEFLHILQKLGSSLLSSRPPSSCGIISVKLFSLSSKTFSVISCELSATFSVELGITASSALTTSSVSTFSLSTSCSALAAALLARRWCLDGPFLVLFWGWGKCAGGWRGPGACPSRTRRLTQACPACESSSRWASNPEFQRHLNLVRKLSSSELSIVAFYFWNIYRTCS